MKLRHNSILAILIALVLGFDPCLSSATVPIKHPSGNGTESGANTWNLFGPTGLISISGVEMRMQVLCFPFEDVASSMSDQTNSGGCSAGDYFLEFQIPSGPKKLAVTFSDLVGFTFIDESFGVMECDGINTGYLCTYTNNGTISLPDIVATHEGNTEVTFKIPEIPDFPDPAPQCVAGQLCHQGQGLTFFLKLFGPALPVGLPTIKVKRY